MWVEFLRVIEATEPSGMVMQVVRFCKLITNLRYKIRIPRDLWMWKSHRRLHARGWSIVYLVYIVDTRKKCRIWVRVYMIQRCVILHGNDYCSHKPRCFGF
jgi:hypothetical protein